MTNAIKIRILAAKMWVAFMAESGSSLMLHNDSRSFEKQPERIINGWLAAARVAITFQEESS
jgi:hypothetical protein